MNLGIGNREWGITAGDSVFAWVGSSCSSATTSSVPETTRVLFRIPDSRFPALNHAP